MILDILKDSIEYSAKDWRSVFELGSFLFFSFLLFPILFVLGYSYNVTQIAVKGLINGDDPLPSFNHWGEMFINGIKIFLVRFLYGLMFIIFIILEYIFISNLFIIIVLSILLGIILYFISTIAVVHMINNQGNIKYAFKIGEILSIINSIGWSKLLGYYLGFMALVFGLTAVITFIFAVLASILGISVHALSLTSIIRNTMALLIALVFAIFILFLFIPYFVIFEARAVGLIYNIQ